MREQTDRGTAAPDHQGRAPAPTRKAGFQDGLFDTIFHSVAEPIILADARPAIGRLEISDINQAFTRETGLDHEEIEGRLLFTCLPPADPGQLAQLQDAIDGRRACETLVLLDNGHSAPRIMRLTLKPFAGAAGPRYAGLLSPAEPATETVTAQPRLAVAPEERVLYARVSHDLRTPLNAILGFSELLQSIGPAQSGDYAAHIHQAGRELLGQIDDLLAHRDLLERGAGPDKELVDVAALAGGVLRANRGVARGAGLDLTLHAEPGLPLLFCHRQLLRHAIGALVQNALAAAPAGSRIELDICLGPDGTLDITCIDDGEIVGAEEVARRLAEVSGAASVMTRGMRRVNTGLALLQRIIDLIGGSVSWGREDGVNARSRVTFRFPRTILRHI